jgi:hypothetical protein
VYYRDFRGPRTPTENANIGRNFRFGPEGKFNLYIRAEFVNIFNRTLMPNPGYDEKYESSRFPILFSRFP